MTCIHIDQMASKLADLTKKMTDSNSSLYERQGPYMNLKDVEGCLDRVNTNINFSDPVASITALQNLVREITNINAFTLNTVKGRMVVDYVVEILNLIKQCNCSSELGSRASGLCNDYNKLVNDYNGLQDRYNNLVGRFNDLRDDYNEIRDKSENIRNDRERERIDNTREVATLRQEKLGLEKQLNDTRRQLTSSENQVANLENRLDQRTQQIEAVRNQLANLRIESSEKTIRLRQKEEEIKALKRNLGTTQKDALNEKLQFKEEKLETLVGQLGIELRRIQNLRRRYKELIIAQEDNNNANANVAQDNITGIKEGLQEGGISVGNIQRICKKCRKIAQLELQLEQTRQEQQFEARQQEANPPRRY